VNGLESRRKRCAKSCLGFFYSRDENPKLFCVFDLTVTYFFFSRVEIREDGERDRET